MTPEHIKARFPNASKSLLAANAEERGPDGKKISRAAIANNEAIAREQAHLKTGQFRNLAEEHGPHARTTKWRFVIPGAPMGKPRMTNRDRWAKRPSVQRYWKWKAHAKACAPEGMTDAPMIVSWTAYLPMPKSWSSKNIEAHRGTLHRSKPDRDNIDKGILDALFSSDACVAGGTIVKRWDDGRGPRLEIEVDCPHAFKPDQTRLEL